MQRRELTTWILRRAAAKGFAAAGIAAVEHMDPAPLRDWLEAGYNAEMDYLRRHLPLRADLTAVLPGAQAVLCVALPYPGADEDPRPGAVARYARGADYHTMVAGLLGALWEEIRQQAPGAEGRVFVDGGPLPERELARRAGIGWPGKHSLLIARGIGTRFVLGEILTTLPLVPSTPTQGTCGSCRRCLAACPTGAIISPGVVDARRCLSYLTIEHKGPIPRALRALVGTRVFGCDACQDACPYNRGVGELATPLGQKTTLAVLDLAALLTFTPEACNRRFRYTPIHRAKRRGLLRNACVALGNLGDPLSISALVGALQDAEILVRGHAAWALGRLQAGEPLRQALATEEDPWVREEIQAALNENAGHEATCPA